MKFAEHLSAHITPEWRKQYIQYEAFKDMLYSAQDQAPSVEVTDEDTVKRYFAKFEEKFFQTCEKELAKINTFYSEKLAEAQRRFATLQNELQSSLDAQKESTGVTTLRQRRKPVFHLSHEERVQHRNIKDLKLAFSEFYLSLILLQNYQNLNFTGFRKILKKHDKILETPRGADWRVAHVEVAPFYTCKKINQLISETEAVVTNELEDGDRQKAMKRLRVPPLGAAQPAPAWTTFRVGLFCGIFIVLNITLVLAAVFKLETDRSVWPLIRIYRGGFLLIEFLFLLGINTYGWRQAGVNHVLIFELNPRSNLSHQHLFEIAGFLGILWCLSLLACFFAPISVIPTYVYPLVLYGFMVFFLINPTKTFYYKSRFWLLKLLVSPENLYTVFGMVYSSLTFSRVKPRLLGCTILEVTTHIVVYVSSALTPVAKNTVWLIPRMLCNMVAPRKVLVHFFPLKLNLEYPDVEIILQIVITHYFII